MSAPLTPERLAEIRASIPLGYEGPWDMHHEMVDGYWLVGYDTDNLLAGLVAKVPDYGAYLAEFIAEARTAVPELLAEVERLRAERDAYCDRVDTLTAVAMGNVRHVQRMYGDLQKAHAEVARLTALVAAMHAAAVGESRPPLLGLVEDVAGTRDAFLAQQARADTLNGIAREMAARVAELEEDSATLHALYAAGVDNWEGYSDALAGEDE